MAFALKTGAFAPTSSRPAAPKRGALQVTCGIKEVSQGRGSWANVGLGEQRYPCGSVAVLAGLYRLLGPWR